MSERHALLPLRAFLGATFVYAGVDKLADPVFFESGAFGSLATQLDAARGPLESLLDSLVPHAGLLGATVALLEIVVGIAALTGVLTKPAAWVGATLSAGFALTIGWGADPWYFGHDLPYLAAWLPLAIGGPGEWTVPDLLRRIGERTDDLHVAPADPGRRALLLQGGAVLLGAASIAGAARTLAGPLAQAVAVGEVATTPVTIAGRSGRPASTTGAGGMPAASTTTSTTAAPPATTTPTTAAPQPQPPAQPATTTPQPATPSTQPPTTQAPATTTTTTAPPATTTTLPPEATAGPVIATSASVQPGAATPFQDPRSGRRGLLVRRGDGALVAFDEKCTHQGCSVLFIAEEKRFGCPCHGSSFDAATGVVLNGPATAPLPQWAITESGGEIRLA